MMTCRDVCQHALMPPQRLTLRQALARFLHLMLCGQCRLALRQFKLMLQTTPQRQAPAASPEQVKRWLQGVATDRDKNERA